MKKHLYWTALALLAASCSVNDDTVDGPVQMSLSDIVTFDGNAGGRARFSFQQVDDSPMVNLVAQGELKSDDLEEGDRLYIVYIPESGKPYTSGNITLRGASLINCGDVVETEMSEMADWNRDKVYVLSLWRSGTYVNLHCRLTFSKDPRIFRLSADPATLGSAYPDLYVHHELPAGTDNYDHNYYASWNMAAVWNLPTTEGVRVHVANSNMPQCIFEFRKNK